jgi:excinuclease ABC subunit A
VGVLYILDEPSIGLHQRDNEKLIGTLKRLRDVGNTVLVVEHDEGRCAPPTISSTSARAPVSTAVTWSRRGRRTRSAMPESLTGQFLAGTRTIECPASGARPVGYIDDQGRG